MLRDRLSNMPRAALDLGSCSDPSIVFKSGLDGRNTPAFIATNQKDFNHGSALNIAVIAGFICQRLDSTCKAGADAKAACSSASAAAVATSQNQAAADAFNSILAGGNAPAAAAATPTAAAQADTAASDAASGALDLGSCSNPSIEFKEGLDGRNTPAFIAANQKDFNHGSALNIAVIAGFICQRLDSTCKAGDAAKAACSSASAAAVATSQNQAAADAFNSILAGGGAAAVATPTAAADLATTAAAELAGAVQTGIIVQVITSCS
jgi:hypothetical protein